MDQTHLGLLCYQSSLFLLKFDLQLVGYFEILIIINLKINKLIIGSI